MASVFLNGTMTDRDEGLAEGGALLMREDMSRTEEGVMMVVQGGVVRRDDLGLAAS